MLLWSFVRFYKQIDSSNSTTNVRSFYDAIHAYIARWEDSWWWWRPKLQFLHFQFSKKWGILESVKFLTHFLKCGASIVQDCVWLQLARSVSYDDEIMIVTPNSTIIIDLDYFCYNYLGIVFNPLRIRNASLRSLFITWTLHDLGYFDGTTSPINICRYILLGRDSRDSPQNSIIMVEVLENKNPKLDQTIKTCWWYISETHMDESFQSWKSNVDAIITSITIRYWVNLWKDILTTFVDCYCNVTATWGSWHISHPKFITGFLRWVSRRGSICRRGEGGRKQRHQKIKYLLLKNVHKFLIQTRRTVHGVLKYPYGVLLSLEQYFYRK